MSIEALGIIASIILAALGIIKVQLDTRALIGKSNTEIAKLKAEADAHVVKKQVDIDELAEKREASNAERMFQQVANANEQAAKTREALALSQSKLIDLTERQVKAQEAQTITQSKQADTSAALMQSFSTLSEIVPTILGLNAVMTEFETVRVAVGKFDPPDTNIVMVLQKMSTDIDAIKAFNEKRREIDIQTASLLKTVNASLVSIKERLNQIPGMPKAPPEVASPTLDTTTLQKVKLEGTIGEITEDPAA